MTVKAERTGPLGALMDEYERAGKDLSAILNTISDEKYERIFDSQTKDENCRSIQRIMRHVIGAGYGYADAIRAAFSIPSARPDIVQCSRRAGIERFDAMLAYTAETLESKKDIEEDDMHQIGVIAAWGQPYTLEQMLEHAIVHVLRHRRQIERSLVRSSQS